MSSLSPPRSGAFPLLLLAAIFLAWQLPGLAGRSPWKSDEAYTMGLVHHMVESGDVVVPELGGEPFMQKPPVFFAIAAAFAKLFSGILPLHVGARASCVLFNLVTMLFVALASRELNGKGRGWPAAILLLACIGPLHMAHFILTDLALLSGIAIGLYGLALGLRRAWAGGLWCGTGAGLAFMSKGLIGPGILGVTVLVLPLCDAGWRNKDWLRFTCGCVIAALPWVIVWPVALFLRSPELFSQWIVDNNFGRFNVGLANLMTGTIEGLARRLGRMTGGSHLAYHDVNGPKAPRGYMLWTLPWYAFPASLLAAWTFWREGRAGWTDRTLRAPVILLAVGLLVFTASRDGRELYAMPLVVPLLVLGARRLDKLSENAVLRINRISDVLFLLVAVAMWVAWFFLVIAGPVWAVNVLHRILPGYVPVPAMWPLIFAVLGTVAWLILVLRVSRDPEWLVVRLAAGVSLLYLLAMTIFLPFAEWQMSYERQFAPLRGMLPPRDVPVMSRGLGEPQRAMLDYYAGLKTIRIKPRREVTADWLLVQSALNRANGVIDPKLDPPADAWERVWNAAHEGEAFQLFRRRNP